MKAKVTKLKTTLIGMSVPDSANGYAGRYVEQELIQQGFDVDTRGTIDIPGLDIEVKTRDLDATSAQTVGKMSLETIKNTPYKDSTVREKIQRQFRVSIRDNTIVGTEVVDFTWDVIQDKIEKSYEAARDLIIQGCEDNYIPGGHFGYFERTVKNSDSYDFRLSDSAMNKLIRIANSTARDILTFDE